MNPGEILDNRYEIVQRLGAGGMGEVYLATHTHLGSQRVIKVVHPHISGNSDARDRFLREARAATKVHHPNVATLHDFSTLPDGSHYMVWEYIDGENLAQKLRTRGVLPPREAVRLIVQSLHGLEAIHRAGIIHRDISPENLMIARDDETVKIIDLGVAKIEDSDVGQTRTGIFVGKLRYAAPEQLGFLPENEKIDARADIYATAMVLVELLTGRPPYEAKSPHEYFILHASPTPTKSVELPPDLPGSLALQAVLVKALARDRNERFATAREFANALEEIEKTLPNPRDLPTMAMPLDGDETMKLGRKTVDTLHRSTVITEAKPAAPPPPPPVAAAPHPPQQQQQFASPPTILTPLPEQQFQPHAPKQGSAGPLIVIVLVVIMLLGAGAFAVYKVVPIIKGKFETAQTTTAPTTTTTTATTTAATTTQQPQIAEANVTVTSGTADTLLTATVPPAVIVENTQTAAPVRPPVTTTTTTTAPSKPPVVVVEKPPVKPPVTETASTDEGDDDSSSSSSDDNDVGAFSGLTYVDGGGDDDQNERAMNSLRRHLRGTKAVALRAGGMTPELARALREEFPNIRFEAEADVVIRFEGRFERRARALKRRAATATVSKNGRVIFRYQLPDEVYRVGNTPVEAFVRVLSNAINE